MPKSGENKVSQIKGNPQLEGDKSEEVAEVLKEEIPTTPIDDSKISKDSNGETQTGNTASVVKGFDFNVGDTIVVTTKLAEESRTRNQKFEGIVIAQKGHGISKTFTMRQIGTNKIGVERIFPVNSPLITKIKVKRAGNPRRAKLYYLRNRKGKSATFVKPL